ncbi:hypothetical protein TIFTF001_043328, partial [Ficus carica]
MVGTYDMFEWVDDVCEAIFDEFSDGEGDNVGDEEYVGGDTGLLLVVRRSCLFSKCFDDEWLRTNIFLSTCTVNVTPRLPKPVVSHTALHPPHRPHSPPLKLQASYLQLNLELIIFNMWAHSVRTKSAQPPDKARVCKALTVLGIKLNPSRSRKVRFDTCLICYVPGFVASTQIATA